MSDFVADFQFEKTTPIQATFTMVKEGGGVSSHNELSGRDVGNQHPISSITGLQEVLDGLENDESELGDQVQSLQADVNILKQQSIPSKTSDLENDSGFISSQETETQILSGALEVKNQIDIEGNVGHSFQVSVTDTGTQITSSETLSIYGNVHVNNPVITSDTTSFAEAGSNSFVRKEQIVQAISGSGGTSDYTSLSNKPSIANITLEGNKTLEDLGIQPVGSYATEADIATHNLSEQAHNDIRNSIKSVADDVASKADSTTVSDIQTTLAEAVEDIEFLQNDMAVFIDVSKDSALKSKDNEFTGNNTFKGNIILDKNQAILSNGAVIKDGTDGKNILNLLEVDSNTQQLYLGNDKVWIKGPDDILLEGGIINTKRLEEDGSWKSYTNIDTGNLVDNLPSNLISAGQFNIELAKKANTSDVYTKTEVDAKVSSVYKFKGSVANYEALPTTDLVVGDTYNIEDTGANYAWTGMFWDKLSETIDLSNYVALDNDQTISGTKSFTNTIKTKQGLDTFGDENIISTDGNSGVNISVGNANTQNVKFIGSVIKHIYNSNDYEVLDTRNMSELLPIASTSFRGLVRPDGSTITVNSDGVISSIGYMSDEKYGIQADYSLHYGILECPNGLIHYSINNKEIEIQPGIVFRCAGNGVKTMIASATKYSVGNTGDITLFFVRTESSGGTIQISFLEAKDVYYSEVEPDDGADSYLAWWQPSRGMWQFKSVDTGNVWRTAVATPLADIKAGEIGITSISYAGYRIFDDDVFAQMSDIENIHESITDLRDDVNELLNAPENDDVPINLITDLSSLETNKAYRIISGEDLVVSYPEVDASISNTILIQAQFTADISIDWGDDVYFYYKKVPTIAVGNYDIALVYNANIGKWCVSVVEVGVE
ncbi:MAG: hypothetical protein NC124_02050 [Clostridium sp.]|nr:hypothetical protein [Clostridium sp.]